jgi:hypothetical protein
MASTLCPAERAGDFEYILGEPLAWSSELANFMHILHDHGRTQNIFRWLASGLAIFGGLLQLLLALSILFLPVFETCQLGGGQPICESESYIQLGGNALGYTFLILMIIVGLAAAASPLDRAGRRVFFTRWLAALSSVMVAVVAGFGFGIVFVPGAILLILASLLTNPILWRGAGYG